MTRKHLITTYEVHLRMLLSSAYAEIVVRDVCESERDRVTCGLDPLSRHESHELVLRQAREKAVEQTEFCARACPTMRQPRGLKTVAAKR